MHDLHLIIDETEYRLQYAGPQEHLRGRLADAREWSLAPLRFDLHCRLLEDHLGLDAAGGLVLDEEGYARDLLQENGIPVDCVPELLPIVLWWATGCAASCQERVRAWTHGERLQALQEARLLMPDGSSFFRPVRYLRQMLQTCAPTLASDEVLDAAHAGIWSPALAEACRVNQDDGTGARLAELDEAEREELIHLCRQLGWTPRQVLQTPAYEIDLLLQILPAGSARPLPEAGSPLPEGHSTWAASPDAVVIQVDAEDE